VGGGQTCLPKPDMGGCGGGRKDNADYKGVGGNQARRGGNENVGESIAGEQQQKKKRAAPIPSLNEEGGGGRNGHIKRLGVSVRSSQPAQEA